MAVRAKPAQNSPAISLNAWRIFPRALSVEIEGLIRETLEADPPTVFLPHQYAPRSDGKFGPAVSDPLAVYVELPFGNYQEEGPAWQFSLSDLVAEAIDWEIGDEQSIAMEAELRRLADLLGSDREREKGREKTPAKPQES